MGMFWLPLFDTAAAEPAGGGAAPAAAPAASSGKEPGASAPPPAKAGSSASTGAPVGKDGQPPAGGSASASDELEYTVDGKTFKVSRTEAIALAQKGHDYTRKTQGLADSRKKLESEFQTRIRQGIDQELARLRQKETQDPPDPISELRTGQERLQQRLDEERWTREMTTLKGKYPLINEQLFTLEIMNAKAEWDQVEELAQQHQQAREAEREEIFNKIFEDEKNPLSAKARQKVIDDYIARKESETKKKTEAGGGGSPSSKREKQEPVTDFNEVDRRVLEKLAGM